jgi:hypothetical protein
MDNVQKHNICINVPSSETVRPYLVTKSVAFYETRWFVHKNLPLDPILSQLNPVHTLTSMLLFSHLRLALVCAPFLLRFHTKTSYAFFFIAVSRRLVLLASRSHSQMGAWGGDTAALQQLYLVSRH